MKRIFFIFLFILVALFSYLTYQKFQTTEKKPDNSYTSERSDKKEKIRNFWKHHQQATNHRIAGNKELAIVEYKNALEINDQHEDALYYLGNMHLELGEYQKAEKEWMRLLKNNPNSARAHFQLGKLYLNYQVDEFFDIEKAEAEFLKTFEINKEDMEPLLHLGQILLIKGKLQDAQSYFLTVVGSNFKNVEAYFLNGYIAWKRGESELALISLSKALEYSKPKKPTKGVLGEGDTKEGVSFGRPMNQSIFYDQFHELRLMNEIELPQKLETKYRELDRFISEVRRNVK